jgi:CheY-like chemotaxis protein
MPAQAEPLAGRRCLVVDDLPINREIMGRQLEKLGARVDFAEDGFAGLRMLRAAAEVPYDMALIDRSMPLMDGLALARAAAPRAGEAGGLPVTGARLLVLCASGRIGEMSDTVGLFGALLLKPVMVSRLRALAVLLVDPAPQQGEPEVAAEPAVRGLVRSERALEGRRILLAEDNATNQMVTRAILQRAGASVEVVADGSQAVDAVAGGRFDVVLMDVQMPGMDGLSATRAIRRAEAPGHHLPVIGLTAGLGPEYERECREAGMDSYLSKPVARGALVRVVLAEVNRERI